MSRCNWWATPLNPLAVFATTSMTPGFSAPFGHTPTCATRWPWGGSANLCDESGQAIAGFKAISPTPGCDCVNAFPPAGHEPASAVLMFAGLGCALNACAAPVGKTARLLEKVGD